jgi:dolichol-phosphate hexosyltransferase
MKTISIVIPALNEEDGLKPVLKEIPHSKLKHHGYNVEVIVVDNNSTDATAEVAREAGVTVIHEAKRGKGHAMRTAFDSVSPHTDIVVMLDADNTYRPKEMLRMIEPIESGFCDCVVGSRLGGRMADGSLAFQNRVANWGYTFLVRQFYRANVTDVLSGYFAWDKKALDDLRPHITSKGFAIEMEMITKMIKLEHEVYSVPITYDRRHGHSKISSIADGVRILLMFFGNLPWRPGAPRHLRAVPNEPRNRNQNFNHINEENSA